MKHLTFPPNPHKQGKSHSHKKYHGGSGEGGGGSKWREEVETDVLKSIKGVASFFLMTSNIWMESEWDKWTPWPTLLFHSKVDDGGFCGRLWRVVGVGHLGGDVEPEVGVVLHLLVTQTNHEGTTWQKPPPNLLNLPTQWNPPPPPLF